MQIFKRIPSQYRRLAPAAIALLIALVSLPVLIMMSQRRQFDFSSAQAVNVQVVINGNQNVPSNTTSFYDVEVKAGNAKVAFAKAVVTFDRNVLELVQDVQTDSPLTQIITRTSRTDANNTGKVEIVLGLAPDRRENPPTGNFHLAQLAFRPKTQAANTNTTLGLARSEMQIVDISTAEASISTQNLNLVLNPVAATPAPTQAPTSAPTTSPTNPATQTPVPTSTPAPSQPPTQLPGNLISNFNVLNNRTYQWFRINQGTALYSDRGYQFTTVPSTIQNEWALRTINDDKFTNSNEDLVSFRVNQNTDVYILYTNINSTLESSWLTNSNGWELANFTVNTNLAGSENTRIVRVKRFAQGSTVTLKGNGATSATNSMYNVVLKPVTGTGGPVETPTTAPTQAPTSAPTQAPTQAPTAAPTQSPTTAPTASPTPAPTAAPTAPPSSGIAGLLGSYYSGTDFNNLVLRKVDPNVNFAWGRNIPTNGVPADYFSVRWEGFIEAPESGTYRFITLSDDGVRLSINNHQLINNWDVHAAALDFASVNLSQGKHSIKMEYFDGPGNSTIRLAWVRPSGAIEIIPASYFSHTPVSGGNPGTPSAPLTVSNIQTSNGKAYKLDTLSNGKRIYIDRIYTFTNLPPVLNGVQYIQTANDDKNTKGANHLSFDINKSAVVYVLHDDRVPAPSWLSSFTKTEAKMFLGLPGTFTVYYKPFPAGKVTLGGNTTDNSNNNWFSSMYSLFIMAE